MVVLIVIIFIVCLFCWKPTRALIQGLLALAAALVLIGFCSYAIDTTSRSVPEKRYATPSNEDPERFGGGQGGVLLPAKPLLGNQALMSPGSIGSSGLTTSEGSSQSIGEGSTTVAANGSRNRALLASGATISPSGGALQQVLSGGGDIGFDSHPEMKLHP